MALSLALAGCMQPTPPPDAPPASQKRAAVPGVSPRAASVSIVGFDGGSEERTSRFAALFADAAGARDVTTAPAGTAHYFLRGYLTATPTGDGGVRLAYVCDLFDRRKQRAQRLANAMLIPARGPDPWAAADDLKIAALASQGAQDLADTLTNMPEAIAAAPARPASPGGTTSVARQQATPASAAPAMQADNTAE